MKWRGKLAALGLAAAGLAEACGGGHHASMRSDGTGGTSGDAALGSAGALPDLTPFCAQVCKLEAAVDCSTGTAVPVDGDPDVPVDDPTCADDWCGEDPSGIADPTPQKPCDREWGAYVECSSRQTSDAYGCYGPFHTSVDPYLCVYPELEDYNNCRSSGGTLPYQPPE